MDQQLVPISETISIHVLTHKNPERKARMIERFQKLRLPITIFESEGSCMEGHLGAISQFYQSGKPYGIICEDDIYIHKDFANRLSQILFDFKEMSLDVLLLGYLITCRLERYYVNYPLKLDRGTYFYTDYPKKLWGAQMYMITRDYAEQVLKNMSSPEKVSPDLFISDWIITKYGKRALIYPMLAVEEGDTPNRLKTQKMYHLACKSANYIESEFI